LLGITFILFPMLAQASAARDALAVANYVNTGTRISLLITGLAVAASAGLAGNLLRLVFPARFAELGGDAMRILAVGLGGFALFGVFSTVLNSIGKQWPSLAVTLGALGSVVGLNAWFVQGSSFGPELLEKTAWATSVSVVLAAIVSGVLVRIYSGASMPMRSALRVGFATLICALLGAQFSELSRLFTLLAAFAIAAVYVALLVLLRELTAQDFRRVTSAFRRVR
jgi:stage V sporulation protein B